MVYKMRTIVLLNCFGQKTVYSESENVNIFIITDFLGNLRENLKRLRSGP